MPRYATVKRLLMNIGRDGSWHWLEEMSASGRSPQDRIRANKFMLGAIIDYQQSADVAWENARRLSEDVLGDPKHLWVAIAGIEESYWNSVAAKRHYRLHYLLDAHKRVRRIGCKIVDRYDGDALNIWKDQAPPIVRGRLLDMQVGKELSPMIVGALIDTRQIEGQGDFKADEHVRKVLGRVFRGKMLTSREAHEIGNRMVPGNSWILDNPLYWIGKKKCKKSVPRCGECELNQVCTYAQKGKAD